MAQLVSNIDTWIQIMPLAQRHRRAGRRQPRRGACVIGFMQLVQSEHRRSARTKSAFRGAPPLSSDHDRHVMRQAPIGRGRRPARGRGSAVRRCRSRSRSRASRNAPWGTVATPKWATRLRSLGLSFRNVIHSATAGLQRASDLRPGHRAGPIALCAALGAFPSRARNQNPGGAPRQG